MESNETLLPRCSYAEAFGTTAASATRCGDTSLPAHPTFKCSLDTNIRGAQRPHIKEETRGAVRKMPGQAAQLQALETRVAHVEEDNGELRQIMINRETTTRLADLEEEYAELKQMVNKGEIATRLANLEEVTAEVRTMRELNTTNVNDIRELRQTMNELKTASRDAEIGEEKIAQQGFVAEALNFRVTSSEEDHRKLRQMVDVLKTTSRVAEFEDGFRQMADQRETASYIARLEEENKELRQELDTLKNTLRTLGGFRADK